MRRDDHRDSRNADRYRVELFGDHTQCHAQLHDDERKFTDLRQSRSGAESHPWLIAHHEGPEGAGQDFPRDHQRGDEQDRSPQREEDTGIDVKPHRDEKDGAEDISEGRDNPLHRAHLSCLADDGARDECAKGDGISQLQRQQ